MTENLKQFLTKPGTRSSSKGQAADALVGQRLGEEYQIVELLGQGAMARVYKARQLTLDRAVAIKILTSNTPEVVARFVHEIKVHSLLKHVNIVEALDCVTDVRTGQTCFVMEYLEGTSLQQVVRSNPQGLRSEEDLFFILSQVSTALNYAHRQGVIHRDLKPANMVLVETSGAVQVKVVDFGMARLHEQLQRFTKTGHIVGSPLYMSPEQCMGRELDPRSDVYALALVTYELATGKAPYAGAATLYDVMQSHCDPSIKPEPIAKKNPAMRLSDRLDAIIWIALETNPDKRFQTVKHFEEALKTWYQAIQKNMSQDEIDLFPLVLDDEPGHEQYFDPKQFRPAANLGTAAPADPSQIITEDTVLDPDTTTDETDETAKAAQAESDVRPRTGWRIPEKVSTHPVAGWGVVSGQELSYIRQCEPIVGKLLNEKYRVQEIIGEGGFSVVYRAIDQETGKPVAIKSLKFVDPELAERFSREITLHLELKHPNIVRAIERLQQVGHTLFVMELLNGTVLEDYLEREFSVSDFNDICSMVSQLFDALEFAHDQGIIHRDLKPGNIMLLEQGGALRVKVLDFGLAQIQDNLQRLTRTGMLVGSPAYMSPEHCMGHTLTLQSDIYSLGILSYELICGNLPYDGDSDIAMVKAHCDKNLVAAPLSTHRSDLPATEKLEAILAKALIKDPTQRYEAIEDFRKAFDEWWQEAGKDPDASPFKERKRRRRKSEVSENKGIAVPAAPTATSVAAAAAKTATKESENLGSIVDQYRQAQVETVTSKWRGDPRMDRQSGNTVKMVLITVLVFCFLGTVVWFSMQQKPAPPAAADNPEVVSPTPSTPSTEVKEPETATSAPSETTPTTSVAPPASTGTPEGLSTGNVSRGGYKIKGAGRYVRRTLPTAEPVQ